MRTPRFFSGLLFVGGLVGVSIAQRPTAPTSAPTAVVAAPKPDTTRKPTGPTNGPKAYKEVITAKAQTQKGMFSTHKVEDKYYFEIPDSLIGREILVVNRISKAPADLRSGGFFGYAGAEL
jgi:hypothetical protein